jgi:uncharacterized repeat protein (TIGR03803 family)
MTPSTLSHVAMVAITLLTLGQTATASETVIQNFGTTPDGRAPFTPLVADASGNLYGAAAQGGKYGQGVLYELSPPTVTGATWTETPIYSFPPSKDIGQPQGALVKGPNGVLYGTASAMGGVTGYCTAFQLTPPAAGLTTWTETNLYNFSGQSGTACAGAMIAGAGGVLYGTLPSGGPSGTGAIFQLTPPASGSTGWTMTSVYAFGGCTTSTSNTPGNLVAGPGGALYGLTAKCGEFGNGAVFKLTPPGSGQTSWTESEIYSFASNSVPFSALSAGTNGVVYGTLPNPYGSGGTIAALAPPASGQTAWTETVIYTFSTAASGFNAVASLVPGAGGSLYGTTTSGGAYGYGTAFKLSPPASGKTQWRETVLHSFTGTDGGNVAAALVKGPGGLLYGAASIGGASGNGTVFSLTLPTATHPEPVETPLYAFSGVAAVGPNATLVGDGTGALYGISGSGNSAVFKLMPPATGQTNWTYEQFYDFGKAINFGEPQAPLVRGKNGVFYGIDFTNQSELFVLNPPTAKAPAWTKTTILYLGDYLPGVLTGSSLIEGPDGTLYGVTHTGTAFAVTPPANGSTGWNASTIFQFPNGELINNYFLTMGTDGTLYGTSSYWAMNSSEYGSVFKLTPPSNSLSLASGVNPPWTLTFIYNFTGDEDGSQPNGPLLAGPDGVLYGTTLYGGSNYSGNPFGGYGTVFALSPPPAGQTIWNEKLIYSFPGGLNGSLPQSTLLKGKDGALYGITSFGGQDAASYESASGNGTVYKLTPPAKAGGTWTHTVFHRFGGGRGGSVPLGGLMLNTDGKLYGTTVAGGAGTGNVTIDYPFGGWGQPVTFAGSGTVFQITP